MLLVTPYYNKPTQPGVAAHFEAVAAASGLPVMLYDIPGRTGVTIAEDTYRPLADNDRFVAVKDAVATCSAACGSCATPAWRSTPATTCSTSAG